MSTKVGDTAGRGQKSMALMIAPGTYLVSVRGGLDDRAGRFVERELGRLVRAGAREVVVDLVDTEDLDPTGLGPIADAGRRFAADADLTIACDDEGVLRLLGLVSAERYFHLARGLTDAFGRLARNRLSTAA